MPKPPLNARHAAAEAIALAAERFPEVNPGQVRTQGLSGPDAQLARLLYRVCLQRWLTLEAVIEPHLSRPFDRLEPKMQAVLLVGAAQVLFVQGVPDYAAVDAMVTLAKKWIRPKAGGLTNAVMRRVAESVVERCDGPWDLAADRVPLLRSVGEKIDRDDGAATGNLRQLATSGGGGWIQMGGKVLPPVKDRARHLSAATGVPKVLVDRWLKHHGARAARDLCVHASTNPPLIVSGFGGEAGENVRPHAEPGFGVFLGDYAALTAWLKAGEGRRVQDPTAAGALDLARGLEPVRVLDYCAGRGTKTGQLAVLFPEARVDAWDPDDDRRADLKKLSAANPQIRVLSGAGAFLDGAYDLILLDVPCSNTGVLARRPEARYRFGDRSLASLLDLQQSIAGRVQRGLSARGAVLYATCSVEPEENRAQAQWIARQVCGEIRADRLVLPVGGDPACHRDGGYAALIQRS